MLSHLIADFRIIFDRDPAARNWLEVLLCYPGLQALTFHRLSHGLHRCRIPVIPRLISQFSRLLTGIEIHPGAVIGKGVFIDHGMGVVIGETAIVGDYALIYQGVTLGGTGKESGKRHPTLGENVVVGAGAKVLGNLNIGDNVRIGAGSVVLRDVPSDCTVVGVPGRIIYRSGVRVNPLEHGSLPDSEAQVIRALVDRIEMLEQSLEEIKQLQAPRQSSPENPDRHLIEVCYAKEAAADTIADPQAAIAPEQHDFAGEDPSPTHANNGSSCRLRDKIIEEFLDGAGI